eukprot:TRINITY_DN3735_c0_g1_i2.p1 TRINITY_DN3735_c0_g1~~TRINITY_DN3735_c0_g1_i2.p1  ORF type:complete len:314 (+),score=69.77 TRINITY_DN3735_c0_g1_i2:178-1119(+)
MEGARPQRAGHTNIASKYAGVSQTCVQGGRPTYSASLPMPKTLCVRDNNSKVLRSTYRFRNWPSVAGVVQMRNTAARMFWKTNCSEHTLTLDPVDDKPLTAEEQTRIDANIAKLKDKYNLPDPVPLPKPVRKRKRNASGERQLALVSAAPPQQLVREMNTMRQQMSDLLQCIKSLKDTQLELTTGHADLQQRQENTAQTLEIVDNVQQGLVTSHQGLKADVAEMKELGRQLAAGTLTAQQVGAQAAKDAAAALQGVAAAQQRGNEAAEAAAAAAQVAAAAQRTANETAQSTSTLARAVDMLADKVITRLAQLD